MLHKSIILKLHKDIEQNIKQLIIKYITTKSIFGLLCI